MKNVVLDRFVKNIIRSILFLFFSFMMASCSKDETVSKSNQDIYGSGASFPAIIYTNWSVTYFDELRKKVSYQSIGSSAGVKQIIAKIVDFGATDAPLSDQDLNKEGLFQFPTVIGGVVLVVNIPGIPHHSLVLSGPVVADIYLGKIKKWNDPEIVKLNPNIKLPDQPISVVRRAEGSGTTYVFTQYLSKVSPEWHNEIGSATTVSWKVGVGGKGNDGVTTSVKTISGSIGYVEFAYAEQSKLDYAKMINAAGEIISPNADSFSKAAEGVDWAKTFSQDLTNINNIGAWPIVSTTYILIHKTQENITKAKELLNFFDWALGENGLDKIKELNFVPLPKPIIEMIRKKWKIEIKTINNESVFEN